MKINGFKDTIEWYNQNSDFYNQSSLKSFSVHDRNQLEEFSNLLPKDATILDAGCGPGRDTNYLTDNGFSVTGLDLSSGLIKVAKNLYPKLKFVEGNMLSLPFNDNYFDGIWSHASLLHLETVQDVEKALSEFKRVLKQQGVLHVLVKAQTGDDKTAVVSDSLSKHDRFFQYFTKDEIQNLLTKLGFKLILIKQYKETDGNPNGRPEVEWIVTLAKKIR